MPVWNHPETPIKPTRQRPYEVRLAGIHIPPNPSFQKRNQTQAGFRIPLSGSRFLFRHLKEVTWLYAFFIICVGRQGLMVIERLE
jgi:hypothetical protein